jgi:hypothetical protein
VERYYYDKDGNIPYQMYYPGVKGVWPLHRYRLLWSWLTDHRRERQRKERTGQFKAERMRMNEWNGTRIPGMSRTNGANETYRSTRWPVPVEESLTRMVYLNVEMHSSPPTVADRVKSSVMWPWRNWSLNFNFRNQDVFAEMYGQYDQPEYLSSTDSVVIAIASCSPSTPAASSPPSPR